MGHKPKSTTDPVAFTGNMFKDVELAAVPVEKIQRHATRGDTPKDFQGSEQIH